MGSRRSEPRLSASPSLADLEVERAVADAHHREWTRVLAATVRVTRDLDVAEECVQDAYERALVSWRDRGIPERPGAWLTTVARRRGLDIVRRDASARRRIARLVVDEPDEEPHGPGPKPIPDDRLRLICTCCHPALAFEAQVALTLRLVCGLSTVEVARAFLVSEPTMAARLTRAKKKITAARIPYRIPPAEELPARVGAVVSVVHLLFTTGHTAPVGSELIRRDLVERALDLARLLHTLVPDNADVTGLLALIVLTDARRATRVDATGRLLLLEEQDRSQWDGDEIRLGLALVDEALAGSPTGRYPLQAAMAAAHAVAPTWDLTDWRGIVELYDRLQAAWPSPVVALNRAVAVGMACGPAAGLMAVDAIRDEPRLAGYGYLPAARAEWLRRLERLEEAKAAYDEAIALTDNAVEQEFLRGRRAGLGLP